MELSYVNKKGERITVTQDHLDAAVAIKEELQKMSPSRRCSWSRHRRLMERQGFMDSDTNENYRCLIKRYQKAKGSLPAIEKHVDMVASSKLAAIKEEIGELNAEKLALQEQGRKVRRLVRQTQKDMALIEEVGDALRQTDFVAANNPVVLPNWQDDQDTTMIACLSDIHYGAHVDIKENYYDTHVVANLLESYAGRLQQVIARENVTRVDIVNLGDIVEHAYMRNQNLFDSEETLSEQIVNVTRLIIQFIQRIRESVELVTYRAIAGNHDRLQGDKGSNLNADHAVRISNAIIKMWIEIAGSDVEFVETGDYFTDIDLQGYHFAFVHGDRNNMNNKSTLAKLGEQYDKHYDAVIGGHIHHFTMQEVGDNRYQVTFGSVKGMDEYSIRLGAKACRSQGVVLVNNHGFEIKKINL